MADKEALKIIKIGGKVIDQPEEMRHFLQLLVKVEGKKVLVHGGGKIATEIGLKQGIQPQMHEGRRITDKDTIMLVTMVYAGLINKRIVSGLQALGCNALGLTGADGNTIVAIKRPVKDIDYGFVGDVTGVEAGLISLLIGQGLVPVFAALTHDGTGQMLNTNADTIASELARALSKYFAVELIYCFDKPGVLTDPADDRSVIPAIAPEEYYKLKAQRIISDGMIPKLDNAFDTLAAGVKTVRITHARLLLDESKGTRIHG